MNRLRSPWLALLLMLAAGLPGRASAQLVRGAPAIRPAAVVDLDSEDGLRLVQGRWRFSEAGIQEVDHRGPGADLRASGPPNRTHDLAPHAGAAEFDDSGWPALDPGSLTARRSTGRLSFAWYRINLTIPARVGSFEVRGSTAFLEIVVDDYSEIWVNGKLPVILGQSGGGMISGFNAPNRVVLGRDLKGGERFQVAVFAANGPLSEPPANFIWVRSATLDFHDPLSATPARPVPIQVQRDDPALDRILPEGTMAEQLATGFLFIEGPVWHGDGYLLFSDVNANTIYRYGPDEQVSVFRVKSGYAGLDIGEYTQPGSNGLALDPQGRLTLAEHGRRRVTRLETTGQVTVLAERYQGKRLNSPNDLVYRSDGVLYFTDPPFGLPAFFSDPRKELPYSGLFRLAGGRLTLESTELTGPNGLAFSPDERFLYVDNWDEGRKVVLRFPVEEDGRLGTPSVLFDMGSAPEPEALDGLKVDQEGNLYVSGPGGLWILSPHGKRLGLVRLPELPANFAWGDADGHGLYLTARSSLYRLRLGVAGLSRPSR